VTALGFVFLALYVVSLRWGRVGIASIMALSIGFADSAMVNVGPVSFSPYYFGALLIVLFTVVLAVMGRRPVAQSRTVLFLWVWAGVVTALGPILFAGIPVISSAIGLDQQVDNPSSLGFSISNVAQLGYLTINLVVLLAAMQSRLVRPAAVSAGLGLGVAVALSEPVARIVHLPWPEGFFRNSNRGFYTTEIARTSAQFSEPSHLGAFAAVACVYFAVMTVTTVANGLRVAALLATVASGVVLIASRAATGYAGVAIVLGSLALWGVWRLLRRRFAVRIAVPWLVAFSALAPFVLLVGPLMAGKEIGELNAVKEATGSSDNRAYADLHGLTVLVDTYGLGAGLGANRTSSLLPLLLSTIGIVGVALVLLVFVRILRNAWRFPERRAAIFGFVTYLAAAVVSFADFTNPLLWLLLTFLAGEMGARRAISDDDIVLTVSAPSKRSG